MKKKKAVVKKANAAPKKKDPEPVKHNPKPKADPEPGIVVTSPGNTPTPK